MTKVRTVLVLWARESTAVEPGKPTAGGGAMSKFLRNQHELLNKCTSRICQCASLLSFGTLSFVTCRGFLGM